jgi:hypothetical protein
MVDNEQIQKTIKLLKKDITDDWYCDPQNYQDIFANITKITQSINEKIAKGNGIYSAEKSLLFNIPKGNGGFRYSLEISPIDRIAYHLFGVELIKLLDHTLPFNILSHRKSDDDKTLFKPVIEQWNKFENYTRVCGVDKYIIEIDITNYYDNIDIDILRRELIKSSSDANLSPDNYIKCHFFIESICNILAKISFNGKRGLPQNRDISSFLANIYMRVLDRELKDNTYFRYMDDIRIISDSHADANRVMLKIVESLRPIGLAINSGKTRLLEPESELHKAFINDLDLETKKIDIMINSGRKKYVLESFHMIIPKVIEYLDNGKINERKFRFYANRLVIFLNAKDVKVPLKYKKAIANKLIGAIDKRPDCADQICTLVQAIGPYKKLQKNLENWVTNKENLTFEWASYLILRVLIIQGYRSKALNSFCKDQFKDNNSSIALRGISSLYLNHVVKNEVVRRLSSEDNFFLRRHYLISLARANRHSLRKKYEKILSEDIFEEQDQLFRASVGDDFTYIRQSEKVSHKDLIRELNGYA